MSRLNESVVEEAALSWFVELGYQVEHALHLAPEETAAERSSFGDVVLSARLRDAIARLNPRYQAKRAKRRCVNSCDSRRPPSSEQPTLSPDATRRRRRRISARRRQHRWGHVRLIDFDNPDANDWLAVNQFTVIEGQNNRRPDIVVFVNGLPLGVIELKNAAEETRDNWYAALTTSSRPTSRRFLRCSHYNEVLVISDGLEARVGSLTANREWFKPWRTIEGERCADDGAGAGSRSSRACSRSGASSTWSATSSSSRTTRTPARCKEDRRLPPVPRRQRRGRGDATRQLAMTGHGIRRSSRARYWAGKMQGGERATAASASSGTRRARARA